MNPILHEGGLCKACIFAVSFTLIFLLNGFVGQSQTTNYVSWDFTTQMPNANYASDITNQNSVRTTDLSNATISPISLNGTGIKPVNMNQFHETEGWTVSLSPDFSKYLEFSVTLNKAQSFPNSNFSITTSIEGLISLAIVKPTYVVQYSWGNNAFTNFGTVLLSLGDNTATFTISPPPDTKTTKLRIRYTYYGLLNLVPDLAHLRIKKISLTSTSTAIIPLVASGAATSITTNSATLNGTANAGGGGTLTASFNYGTTISYGSSIPAFPSSVSGNTSTGLSASLTNLSPNTLYHFQASASNNVGTITGADATFYTLANVPAAPTVNAITSNSVNVTINTNGNPPITTYAIKDAISGKYVQADGTLGNIAVFQTAAVWGTKTVTGLSSGTAYSFTAAAANGANVVTAYGPSTTITTDNNQITGDYRTKQTGNFTDISTWEYNIRTNTWVPATVIPTSANNILVQAAHTLTLNQDFSVANGKIFTITSSASMIIAANYSFGVSAGGSAVLNNQALTVQSNSTGTGRIGQVNGTMTGATSLTIERYIPAKEVRKWTFVSSPVTQSIRNSWQQQVFITGVGTGGTPCGAGNGNGGTNDKYNSNGFDDTQLDPASLFSYSETIAQGGTSHWTTIPNTTATNVVPG